MEGNKEFEVMVKDIIDEILLLMRLMQSRCGRKRITREVGNDNQ